MPISILTRIPKALARILVLAKFTLAGSTKNGFPFQYQSFGDDCEDILSSDYVVKRVFKEYLSIYFDG
jgi:hypothetical protein